MNVGGADAAHFKNRGCFIISERALTQLDQSILSKAFRGELVPQDPNDEPASELLARIRASREAEAATKKTAKKKSSKKKSSSKKKKTANKQSKSKG